MEPMDVAGGREGVEVPEHLRAQYMAEVRARQQALEASRVRQVHRSKVAKQKKAKKGAEADASTKGAESSVFMNDSGDQGEAHVAENARYSQYRPQQLQIGEAHPDHIVESASLAAATPPKGEYENRIISNAQLETVVYALQRFVGPRLESGHKAGFFLGDGAGVGKGRQISALIKEMWRKGTRRILWLSHCKDLREDARRDMVDCDITVPSSSRKPANLTKKVKIDVWPGANKAVPTIKGKLESEFDEGVFFATYQLLIAGCKGIAKASKKYARADGGGEGKLGSINEEAAPQIQALEQPGTRFMQILEWLEGDTSEAGPLIVFDECHKAKNLMNEQGNPTLTGVAVRHIQDRLPNAAVLYSSATGISEPNNMAYMVRLGNFGHSNMNDLIKSLIDSGLGASELFSCSLKSEGIYVARQLSYDGAEFELKMINLATIFQVQYGRAAAMWQLLDMLVGKKGCWEAAAKRMMTGFWGDHLRFFKSMLMASKVEALAEEARECVANDYSVVIGLQSTGEANLQAEKDRQGDNMGDLFSAPKVQICRVVDKYLSSAPAYELQDLEIRLEMSQVVSALVCFAEHVLAAGTSAEYATKLLERMRQDSEDRKKAWQSKVDEKRRLYELLLRPDNIEAMLNFSPYLDYLYLKSSLAVHCYVDCTSTPPTIVSRKEERAARGEEHDSDLEDEEADASPEDEDEAHYKLLSCMSLSKMVVDYGVDHKGTKLAGALKALITNVTDAFEADGWTLSQNEMEEVLNKTYQRLEAEEQRRHRNELEVKALELRRVWEGKVVNSQKGVDDVLKKIEELNSRVRWPQDKKFAAAEEDAKTVKSEDEMEASPALKEDEAAEFEDSESEHESGNESDAAEEEYQPGVSDEIIALSSTPRRSQRKRRPSRQLLQDSDDDEDDSPVGVSPVLGKDTFASAEPDVPAWPAGVRRPRSARSGTSGGSSTPQRRSSPISQSQNFAEHGSAMTMSGGSVKRGSAAIDRRKQQQSVAKRLRMDLEAAAAKAGLSVDELHSLAAAEPAEEEDEEDAEDIACMECQKKDDEDCMLLCDWCQQGVHLYCHQPELKEIPNEDTWYCHKCTPIIEKQKIAKDILQKHEEACKTASVSTDDSMQDACTRTASVAKKVEDMAALLAGVAVADETTMCTGTMASGGDDEDYACVTSPCKPAPGLKQTTPQSQKKSPESGARDSVYDEDMDTEQADKENQPAKVVKPPPLARSESIVDASTNSKLDVAAAKSGGSLSATAVMMLAKKKKKSKKSKAPEPSKTSGPSESTCGAPCQSESAAMSTALDPTARSGSVKTEVKVDTIYENPQTGSAEEDAEIEEDDGLMDPDSIEYVSAKRRLAAELECAKKRLKSVKEDMKRAQRTAKCHTAWAAASDDDDGEDEELDDREARKRARNKAPVYKLDSGSEEEYDDDDDASDCSMEPEDEADTAIVANPHTPGRLTMDLMKDMSRVTGIPYNYQQYEYPPGYPKEPALRTPHPVTVKAKLVLKKLIDLMELPPNPLDNLVHLCGGREVVAEMTGRKEMMEMQSDGTFQSVKRADGVSQQALNLTERNKFMDGEKSIAIISEAASTGISLQADKTRLNNKRRIHLTLELPWSADKAIQQFGRSHRSNQTSAPVYKMIMSPAAGEFRFASSAAKRLQSLGAILKGNRDALGAGQNLKEFDIDNKYGQKAMTQFIGELTGCRAPHGSMEDGKFVPRIAAPQIPEHLECPDSLPEGRFWNLPDDLKAFYNCARTWCAQAGVLDRHGMNNSVDSGAKHVKKLTVLLNRLLGMNLQQQQIVFGYLQQLIDHECESAKQNGTFDKGVIFLEGNVREVDRNIVWRNPRSGGGEMVMSTFVTDIGLAYEEAVDIIQSNKEQLEKYGSNLQVKDVGFYIRKYPQNQLGTGRDKILLITGRIRHAGEGKHNVQATTRSPWDNNAKTQPMFHLKSQWKFCKDEKKAKQLWDFWYKYTEKKCQHVQPCKKAKEEGHCGYLSRCQQVKILHGSLLHAWDRILQTNCQGMYKEEEDDHGKLRRKKAEEGDPVEMVSTKFTNADGEQRTVTGMYVRKNIHDSLVHTLQCHEQSMRVQMRAQGIKAVDAELRAVANKAASVPTAAMQQAAELLKEYNEMQKTPAIVSQQQRAPKEWKPNVLQPAADAQNRSHEPKAPAVKEKSKPVAKAASRKSLFGTLRDENSPPSNAAKTPAARSRPSIKHEGAVVDLS